MTILPDAVVGSGFGLDTPASLIAIGFGFDIRPGFDSGLCTLSGFALAMGLTLHRSFHSVGGLWLSQLPQLFTVGFLNTSFTSFISVGFRYHHGHSIVGLPSLRSSHCSSVHSIVHYIVHCGLPPEPAWRQFAPSPPLPIPLPITFPSSQYSYLRSVSHIPSIPRVRPG